jgi:hypothetical protein
MKLLDACRRAPKAEDTEALRSLPAWKVGNTRSAP